MIQIAIVEDEEIYVKQLTEYIRKYQTERGKSIKVTVFADGEDIIENYSGGFDIILMDIQMRFMDGMTAAEKIRQMDQKVIIMFITNMIQYAVRGYEVDAMDYVVKPVEYFSFSQKLDKAVGRMRSEVKEFLTIPIGEGVVKIDIADIYFIEGQRHNVIYHTSRGDYCSRITMKELEEKLAVHNFFRCAKGYLVNMNHVEGFVGSDCVIHNVHIPVSKTSIWNDFMRNGGYYVISGYSKNLYGNSRVGIMSGLSLYPKKRKHEICTFFYRQSFRVGNAEYFSDFDRQRN